VPCVIGEGANILMRDVLIGAGGHARVVYDALQQLDYNLFGLEVRGNVVGSTFYERTLQTPELLDDMTGYRVHVAIGDNAVRADLLSSAKNCCAEIWTIAHPKAILAKTVIVAEGCFLAAGAVLGPGTNVNIGCIINHNCVVDHDCTIGRHSHIAPGAVLGGVVTVGDHVLVGANSTVLPGIKIGSNVTIGAGSVVNKDIPSDSKWVGIKLL
jgi:sugar O-acyltransferase (sialic acid O-acetyltransferase NeuD family)